MLQLTLVFTIREEHAQLYSVGTTDVERLVGEAMLFREKIEHPRERGVEANCGSDHP